MSPVSHHVPCQICAAHYDPDPMETRAWGGTSPCPCGGWHQVCLNCACRFDLFDDGEWGKGVVLLKTCPRSDEFRIALELMGPGTVVEPQPRTGRMFP